MSGEQLLLFGDHPPVYEQLEAFDPTRPEATWTPLAKMSPLQNQHAIGTFDEDRLRFMALRTQRDRRVHLFNIYDEVSPLRCLRDTRVIYDIELPVMSKLIGMKDPAQLEALEDPAVCQDPDLEIEGGPRIYDTMRLFVILDELGYTPGEVKEIITQDIDFIAKLMNHGGGYQRFINTVWQFLPFALKRQDK